MASEPIRIALFAGAGASKAVDSVSYPTTVEFFDKLPEDIRSDPQFLFVEQFLRESGRDRLIDIEEILWGLQTLLDFCRNATRGEGLIGHALAHDRLAHLIAPSWSHGHLAQALSRLTGDFSQIISKINALVFDLYGEAPSGRDIRTTGCGFLKPLFHFRSPCGLVHRDEVPIKIAALYIAHEPHRRPRHGLHRRS